MAQRYNCFYDNGYDGTRNMDRNEVNQSLNKISRLALVHLAGNSDTDEQEAAVDALIYEIIPELKKLFLE